MESFVRMGYRAIGLNEEAHNYLERGFDVKIGPEERLRHLLNLEFAPRDFAVWKAAKRRYAELNPEGAFRIYSAHGDSAALEMMRDHEGLNLQMRRSCEMALAKYESGSKEIMLTAVSGMRGTKGKVVRKEPAEPDPSFEDVVRLLEDIGLGI